MSIDHAPPDDLKSWASKSPTGPDHMAAFQDGLAVRLIATPRENLQTCLSTEPLSDVVERNDQGFDYFPVVEPSAEGRDTIVGLVELLRFQRGEAVAGSVRDYQSPLTENNLIGADADILTFVKGADRHQCRLVMSGSRIVGLVSLSDLQKLPVRASLFALITHSEMTMAAAIRREFNGSIGWRQRLSDDRLKVLNERLEAATDDNNLVDELLFTQFADKITIIRKSDYFAGSRAQFKTDMKAGQDLRDDLAHANDYAATREAAMGVCRTVRSIESWMNYLSGWPSRQVSELGAG